jgi:RNA polymerase sigma-70 factor, ECF subfamily
MPMGQRLLGPDWIREPDSRWKAGIGEIAACEQIFRQRAGAASGSPTGDLRSGFVAARLLASRLLAPHALAFRLSRHVIAGKGQVDTPIIGNDTDSDLIGLVGTGDGPALMTLYDRYNRQAFGLAFRILGDAATAEEVVQDAFLALWRNAKSFDTSRGGVRTWLLTIVHNRAIDRIRAAKSRGSTVEIEVADYAGVTDDPWDVITDQLDGAQVREAVKELPAEQRTAIELAYFQGLTHQEIAERTDTPLGTVKGRLRLGLRKLATTLAPAFADSFDNSLERDRAGPVDT